MMDRGDAYMMMEKMVAAKPQKSFLPWPCKAKRETKTTTPNTESTKMNRPSILALSFLIEYAMKMSTYMISMAAPVPLMVDTSMLFFDTNGRPYLFVHRG